MAKGQDFSHAQRGIVNRYYDNRDSIMAQKIAEFVSELYLAEGKKSEALWKRVETALKNTAVDPKKIAAVLESKDITGLAAIAAKLNA